MGSGLGPPLLSSKIDASPSVIFKSNKTRERNAFPRSSQDNEAELKNEEIDWKEVQKTQQRFRNSDQ